ncbi:serine hydrolase family protein [Candidatus Micrarchaeota archaeon]|nr:serine hydrolase family protein [Candidatus Micrarchaeota archaeon]
MKVFIFHCWGGSSRNCWRGWLADELRKKGIHVVAPDFPNTNNPSLDEWLAEIRKQVPSFDPKNEWILIAHSLGCPTVLRLLESLGENEKIKAAILVAGFAKDLDIPEIRNFVEKEFDWEKIRKKSEKFIAINSDNDPFIALSEGQRVASLLKAEFIVEHNGGHLNEGSGHTSYPLLLQKIQAIS